ncbi:MAG: iron-sulfur cluster biosynthesis transcriptional regulator SufR [Cyanobacteria bacterium P01_F01_bin.153]
MASQQVSTKDDILQRLLKCGSATAQVLAADLSISAQAIRRHLKGLEEEGLIVHEIDRSGSGRPQHVYELSAAGRSRFPDGYDEFALGLLETLAGTLGKEHVSQILREQWVRKAIGYRETLGSGPLKERVARLVDLRRAEGYMAEWEDMSKTGDDPKFFISEHNCAISTVASSFPKVCEHELEMFAIALEGCNVERTQWMAGGEHRCGYVVSPANSPVPVESSR